MDETRKEISDEQPETCWLCGEEVRLLGGHEWCDKCQAYRDGRDDDGVAR